MAIFYPPIDFDEPAKDETTGYHTEKRVLEALQDLDNKWQIFHGFEWREIDYKKGERLGEADLIIFHPDLGILIIEIKGGGIKIENGEWFYESLFDRTMYKMEKSPISQSRRNHFFLYDKLKRTSLGHDILSSTAITHTAWFPDIEWHGDIPPELPNGSFTLDSRHLQNPAKHLRKILTSSFPDAKPWTKVQVDLLIRTLAPGINLLPQLGAILGTIRERLFRMTQGQIDALKSLRNQKRLLIEGCAGSGKTLLAVALAREHLQTGKKVLFTCFNKNLAEYVASEFKNHGSIDVFNFHELVRRLCENNGIPYEVPQDEVRRQEFFNSDCAELLEKASGCINDKYDTIIVDEAYDFKEAWWIALESLGSKGHSYYVFYDRNQNVFNENRSWSPPFNAEPVVLDKNVRNTKPIGDFALRLGKINSKPEYAVNEGLKPEIKTYSKVEEIVVLLNDLIHELIKKHKVPVDDIVVLSPYKYDSDRLRIKDLIDNDKKLFTASMVKKGEGKIRVGTIQAFKGLEADVVILCGIDGHMPACSPANLYVGATRARSILYVIHQKGFNLF